MTNAHHNFKVSQWLTLMQFCSPLVLVHLDCRSYFYLWSFSSMNIFTVYIWIYKMSKDCKKCLLPFSKVQSDVFTFKKKKKVWVLFPTRQILTRWDCRLGWLPSQWVSVWRMGNETHFSYKEDLYIQFTCPFSWCNFKVYISDSSKMHVWCFYNDNTSTNVRLER